MANKITGDENVYPLIAGNGQIYDGCTLKQLALKDFMCAIVQGMAAAGKTSLWTPQEVAYKSATLVNAYINELNKPSE